MKTVIAKIMPWHRRIGLFVSLFALVLAVTGLLLNHTEDFQLGKKYVQQAWILKIYGIVEEKPLIVGYQVGDHRGQHWIVQWNDTVYLDAQPVKLCDRLVGAQRYREELLIACADQMFLVDSRGDVVEQFGNGLGVPTPIDYMGLKNGRISLASEGQLYYFDLEKLEFSRVAAIEAKQIERDKIPPSVLAAIEPQVIPSHSIHWERVLLDLHSGRLLGQAGPWFFDLAAVLLIFLALSGLYIWRVRLNKRH